jgi:hypothetical protein
MGEPRTELFIRVLAILVSIVAFRLGLSRSRWLAIVFFLGTTIALFVTLGIIASIAEKKLMHTSHVLSDYQKGDQTNYDELSKLRKRQRSFLTAYQRCTAVGIGSLFCLSGLLVLSMHKHRLAVGISAVSTIGIGYVAGVFLLPGPIAGSWSGNLGCMTCSYHYCDFENGNTTRYNLCAGDPLLESVESKGEYHALSLGKYIWLPDGNQPMPGQEDTLKFKICVTPFRMIWEDSPDASLKVLAFRNIDYLTQYKFRSYLEKTIQIKSQNNIPNESVNLL